jgi:CubicO group peptidase (beta-lactamase class C family)
LGNKIVTFIANTEEIDFMKLKNASLKRPKFLPSTLALAACITAFASQAQPLPQASPETVGMSTEPLSKLTTIFQQEVADKKLPGAVIMVARKGKLVYSQAFGSLNNAANAPMKDLVSQALID